MAKYTTEVRTIIEHYAGLDDVKDERGYNSIDELIELARPKIFDFNYPIFEGTHKPVLERKILKHYYTREIAGETVGLWKHWLNTKMNEIMPYYNKLYETETWEFEPLQDTDLYKINDDLTKTDNVTVTDDDFKQDTTSATTSATTMHTDDNTTQDTTRALNTDRWNLYSDTPQGALAQITGENNNKWLTNATHEYETDNENIHSDTDESIDESINTTSNFNENKSATDDKTVTLDGKKKFDGNEHLYGKRSAKSYAELIQEYRDIILNIDMMIIKDLSDLFFRLW